MGREVVDCPVTTPVRRVTIWTAGERGSKRERERERDRERERELGSVGTSFVPGR